MKVSKKFFMSVRSQYYMRAIGELSIAVNGFTPAEWDHFRTVSNNLFQALSEQEKKDKP